MKVCDHICKRILLSQVISPRRYNEGTQDWSYSWTTAGRRGGLQSLYLKTGKDLRPRRESLVFLERLSIIQRSGIVNFSHLHPGGRNEKAATSIK